VVEHAQSAEKAVGQQPEPLVRPVTTLAALCAEHAPASIDFLKIDVEGAETEVLRGFDFDRFRPRVITLEAYKPITMAPAYGEWEPLLAEHGYTTAWDDTLNRYYVASEDSDLATKLAAGPIEYPVPKISTYKPAAENDTHPDHRLAKLLAGADMAKLPLTPPETFLSLLTARLDGKTLASHAAAGDAAEVSRLIFGPSATPIATNADTVRGIYREIIDSEPFRAACGRIAASYAW
jgi:hypothetical protein